MTPIVARRIGCVGTASGTVRKFIELCRGAVGRLANLMVSRGRAATGSSSARRILELERRAAALTLPFRVVQRARLILSAVDGMIDKEIAVRCGCHPQVVSRWRRRVCE